MEEQLINVAILNPNKASVIKELKKLIHDWEDWQKIVELIEDHPYDPQKQLDVFADGEENMQKHEILQAKTLTFLNNNIQGHGFIKGFDGKSCDRTDLRLKHRVKHRLQELYVLRACIGTLPKQIGSIVTSSTFFENRDIWHDIKNDYGMDKRAFGKKINFITDAFKRKVIFSDIEQAYVLAGAGFSKPAVTLAGSVIEELLRLYLQLKKIKPLKNDFDGYIKTCENNGLLKSAIQRLTDSVRHFRNIVHLEKETSLRYTISKATAKGAVASIFTVVNDFEGAPNKAVRPTPNSVG